MFLHYSLKLFIGCLVFFSQVLLADNSQRIEFSHDTGLRTVNTEHFEIVYRPRFEWAVEEVAHEAESSYQKLNSVFNSFPKKKITLHIVDSADGPINQTLTAPQPFIRVWVAPPSDTNGYGHLKLSNRFRLLIAHELVHMAMGSWHDQSGNLFGQVRSTVNEPMTFPFALLTQSKRFAPLWFHEGAAVFLETWLTDGQGRILGNLDEAYFRTHALHNNKVPDWRTVDVQTVDEAFNINGSYFYGARFMAWLAKNNGAEKVIQWLREYRGASIHSPFGKQYKSIFGQSLSHDWKAFFQQEYRFQNNNIDKILATKTSVTSNVGSITGLVSKTYFDSKTGNIFFIEVPLHELPRLVMLDPASGTTKIFARGQIGSPAFVNVSVTAFDQDRRLFYFSQDTPSGWRDLYQVDIENGKTSKIVNNLRQTNLAIEPDTGDLWGTVLLRGESHLARLKRPFSEVEFFAKLPHDASIRDFSFSPDGKFIAAVLQNHSKTQMILLDPEKLVKGGTLSFTSIANFQDPENPSWSADGSKLYFSSYANGISNIFCYNLASQQTNAISNVVDGLYKPVVLNTSNEPNGNPPVLAFQILAGDGFQPVRITTEKIFDLSPITYLGESVLESFDELSALAASKVASKAGPKIISDPNNDASDGLTTEASLQALPESQPYQYEGLKKIRLNTLVPAIGQSSTGETSYGIYTESSDVLNHHKIQLGLSTNDDLGDLYWNFTYLHKDTYTFSFNKDRASLYALVNDFEPNQDGWDASISKRFWYQADEAGQKLLDVGAGYNDNLENGFINVNYNAANSRSSISSRRGIEKGWSLGINSNLFFDVGGSGDDNDDPSATVVLNARVMDTYFAPHNRIGLSLNAGTSIGSDAVGFRVNGFPNQIFESGGTEQFRNSAIIPGLDSQADDALAAKHFARVQVSNDFPVLRLYKALGTQRADLIDVRVFGTALFSDTRRFSQPETRLDQLYSLGTQVEIRLKHFFNLNSTLALGYAKVWDENLDTYDSHGFISWNWFSF